MKKIIVTLLLVCSSNLFAGVPVRVVGEGSSYEEAKHNGFRNAIQRVAGSVILSQLDIKNYQTNRNSLLLYSSGYVDNYVIIKENVLNKNGLPTYHIEMEVHVNKNKISHSILSDVKSLDNFDSNELESITSSIDQRRFDAYKMIDGYFYDYPKYAFDLSHTYFITYDNRGNPSIKINYAFSWNKNFLASFNDLLKSIQDGKRGSRGLVSIGRKNVYYFNDITYVHKMIDSITYSNAYQVLVTVYNKEGQKAYKHCFNPETGTGMSMYGAGRDILNIFPNDVNRGGILIPFRNFKEISNMELEIVAAYECKR